MTIQKKIDLRLLSYFQTTVETGNITAAARALNVAQPTLSKALKLLESQLRVTLLVRSAHGVAPTLFGERLMRHARLVTAQVGAALDEVESLRTGAAGKVTVGAGPSWVRRMLPEAVARLLQERPGVDVTVITGFDNRLLEGLEDGQLDFVVTERPLSGEDVDYTYRELSRDDLVVCARREHPLADGRRPTLEEALAVRWALPHEATLARRKLAGRLAILGVAQPAQVLISNSITFLMNYARRADALVYTTRSMLATPEAVGLVELALPDLVSNREAGLVIRKGALLTPTAEALAAHMKAVCAQDSVN